MSWLLCGIGAVLLVTGLTSGSLVYHRDLSGDDGDDLEDGADGADWWKEDDSSRGSSRGGPKEFAATWGYRPAWVVLGVVLVVAGFLV